MSDQNIKNSTNTAVSSQNKLLSSALGMGAGTLASRVLGFARDIVLVGFFPQIVTDAFVLGFKIPNFFRRVMGEGALAVSFIPRYLELKLKDKNESEKLKNIVFTFLFSLSLILAFLGIIFMPQVISFLLSLSGKGSESFSKPESFAFVVKMARFMFFYIFLVTQFAYFMAVLNAHKRFWVAGLAPAFFNLGFLLAVLLPNSVVSFSGQQLAYGVLLGGFLQLLIVGFDHVKHIGFPSFNFSFTYKPFLKVLISTLPSIAGIGVLQFISLINISLCAKVGVGALTYLYLADRLLELPQSLIAVSLGTAMLPNLSELWIKDRASFDKTLSESVRFFLFLALPASVGLIFMALPITQLLFQRGETTFEEVLQVSSLVQVYGGVLIISGINKMFLPIYYSFKNTWYPACVSIIVVTSHYFVGSYLVEIYALKGVVASTLISTFINFSFLSLGLKIFIGRSYLNVVVRSLIHFLPSALILALGLYFSVGYIPKDKNIMFFVLSLAAFILSVSIYFGFSFLFKVKEVVYLKPILRKLGLNS